MQQQVECSLPKNEATWAGGVQMKDEDRSNLRQAVERYKRELRDIPEPNCGRIRELKEKVRKHKLATKSAIYESVERIIARFLGRE